MSAELSDSVAVETAKTIDDTLEHPALLNIVRDLEMAYFLLNEFRTKIDGLHPSVANIFKALF